MKISQMRTSKKYLLGICYSKGVNHHYLFLADSNVGRAVEKLSNGEKKKEREMLQVCPDWRWLAWGSCR